MYDFRWSEDYSEVRLWPLLLCVNLGHHRTLFRPVARRPQAARPRPLQEDTVVCPRHRLWHLWPLPALRRPHRLLPVAPAQILLEERNRILLAQPHGENVPWTHDLHQRAAHG